MKKFKKIIFIVILIFIKLTYIQAQTTESLWFDGVWEGDFKLYESGKTPTIRLKLKDGVFSVEFFNRPCQIKWTLQNINNNEAMFNESIIKILSPSDKTNSNKLCLNGGTFLLKIQNEGDIYWTYRSLNDNSVRSIGTLWLRTRKPEIQAQTNDSTWLTGKWTGSIRFNQMERYYDIVLQVNDGNYSVEFKDRPCQVKWILEEINGNEAKFRESISGITGNFKPVNKICLDGGKITIKIVRGLEPYIVCFYLSPNSTSPVPMGPLYTKNPNESAIGSAGLKVGAYTINKNLIKDVYPLGISIADVKFPDKKREPQSGSEPRSSDTFTTLPIVVSVQEGGPAFFAGISPGDIIVSLGGSWFLRDSSSFMSGVALESMRSKSPMLGVIYDVSDSQYVQSQIFRVTFDNSSKRGKLISQVPVHTSKERGVLPGVKEANAEAENRYVNAQKEALSQIKNNPCGIDKNGISNMAAQLVKLAGMANIELQMNMEQHLIATSEAVCDNSRDGGLTKMESVLLATVLREIPFCEYSPTKDYSEVFNNFNTLKYYSKKGYNEKFWREYMAYKSVTDERKQCFNKLVRSAFQLPTDR